MIAPPTVCPLWKPFLVASRRVLTLWNACTPDAGSPLCGIPQTSNFVASRRVPTLLHPFGEHCNLSLTSCVYDCPAYCRPSLGLGNTAGAEILEGDVWRALKICPFRRCFMIFPSYCRPSLGLGNTARAEILEGDVWGAPTKSQHDVARNDSNGYC